MKRLMALLVISVGIGPMVAMADVTVNAYAQDGAIAYLYDSLGNTYGTTTFSGGVATIDTSSLSFGSYGLAMSYKPLASGEYWYSNIAWSPGGPGDAFKSFGSGINYTVQAAVTGEIVDRQLSGSTATVTFQSGGMMGTYDNSTNGLNAQLGLYRPALTDTELDLGTMSKTWDSSTLGGGYGFSVADAPGSGYGLKLVTITNDVGSYIAQYGAFDNGGGVYDLQFLRLDSADAYTYGSVTPSGSQVDFSVSNLGSGTYDDQVPYYLLMDAAWIFDDDGNYSEAYDAGMQLLNPDYYAIPEPSVLALLGGAGVMLLVGRRFLMM